MAGTNLITRYMNAELPTKSDQRRLPFRPHPEEVDSLYRSINRHVFDNQLTQPTIELGILQETWGLCIWMDTRQRRGGPGRPGTWCQMRLVDKWYSPQWFCAVLAHEMVHQYQWDIDRWNYRDEYGCDPRSKYSGAHGPSFRAWREELARHGVPLKLAFSRRAWFRHQDLHKS